MGAPGLDAGLNPTAAARPVVRLEPLVRAHSPGPGPQRPSAGTWPGPCGVQRPGQVTGSEALGCH